MVKSGGGRAIVAHTPGVITGDLAGSPDGAVVAACVSTRKGPVLDLLYSDRPQEIPGACQPAWTGAGYLVTALPWPPRVVVARRTVLSPEQAAALLPGRWSIARRVVSAVAAAGDRIAVALIEFNPDRRHLIASTIVVLSTGGDVLFRRSLGPRVPSAVGLAPDGTAVWYVDAADGTANLMGIPDGKPIPPIAARQYAWSPDGRYLATATDAGIEVSTWPGGRFVANIPIAAADLSWSAGA